MLRIFEWITSGDAIEFWEGVGIGCIVGPAFFCVLHVAGVVKW